MGMFDNAKKTLQQARDKAEDAARDHGDRIKAGLDKAADAADRRTGGKYAAQVDQARDRAHGAVDDLAAQGAGDGAGGAEDGAPDAATTTRERRGPA